MVVGRSIVAGRLARRRSNLGGPRRPPRQAAGPNCAVAAAAPGALVCIFPPPGERLGCGRSTLGDGGTHVLALVRLGVTFGRAESARVPYHAESVSVAALSSAIRGHYRGESVRAFTFEEMVQIVQQLP